MPWPLERALLCEKVNWSILPHELDDIDPAGLKLPLQALNIFRVLQKASTDLDSLDSEDAEMLESIYNIQKLAKKLKGT